MRRKWPSIARPPQFDCAPLYLNLTKEQAAGILGNLGHESAGFTAYGENGGKGPGVGWAQWTDPGRKARFLQYAQRNGLNPRSDEASYGFLKWELQNTHAKALANLRKQTTVDGATRQFEADFEASGVKHMDRRLGYARAAMNMGGNGSGGGSPLPGAGGTSTALNNARALLGAGSRQAAAALGSKMTPGEWCADFVNGALKSANIKGVSSSVANSFLNWGDKVMDGVKAGDVVVTHRGGGVGQVGGHVGLATGQTRMKNGRLQYQTISGNHGNKVGEGWEYADAVAVRRAHEAVQQTRSLADGINRNAYRPGADAGSAPTSAPIRDQFGNTLGQETPTRTRNDITGRVPDAALRRPAGGGAGGGAGGPVHVQIGSVHGHDGEEVGRKVGDHVRDAMNRTMHDVDPGGFA